MKGLWWRALADCSDRYYRAVEGRSNPNSDVPRKGRKEEGKEALGSATGPAGDSTKAVLYVVGECGACRTEHEYA